MQHGVLPFSVAVCAGHAMVSPVPVGSLLGRISGGGQSVLRARPGAVPRHAFKEAGLVLQGLVPAGVHAVVHHARAGAVRDPAELEAVAA